MTAAPPDSPLEAGDARLIPAYTFEEFVVGPHNRFPHAASLAVAENLGKAYNPLFLYGPVGIGKTHLMQSVGHRVLQRDPKTRVLYVTAQQYMTEVIELLQAGKLQSLRERYRALDLLLVDDIQFLATSEATQEEFFHMFNDLHAGGKQIIMTSDRPPKMLTTLEDRLRSRFEWGLIADIKFTNLETRVAILKKKEGHLKGLRLADDIRLYIASRLKSNIRELEGFLRRIQAYTQLYNEEISLDLVKEILKELLPPEEGGGIDAESGESPAADRVRGSAKSARAEIEGFDIQPSQFEPPPPAKPAAKEEPKQTAPSPAEPKPAVPPAAPAAPKAVLPERPAESLSKPETAVPSPAAPMPAAPKPAIGPVKPLPPMAALTSHPGQIPVVFFYPTGHDKELVQMKKKFDDIITKHKLKFVLHPALEADYRPSPSISVEPFVEKCQQAGVSIGIVLAPSPDAALQEGIFFSRLQEAFDQAQLSLQMVPWDELNKDYRFLNLALDITLIRIKQRKQ